MGIKYNIFLFAEIYIYINNWAYKNIQYLFVPLTFAIYIQKNLYNILTNDNMWI